MIILIFPFAIFLLLLTIYISLRVSRYKREKKQSKFVYSNQKDCVLQSPEYSKELQKRSQELLPGFVIAAGL